MTQTFNEPVEFEAEVRHKVLPVVFVDKLAPGSATPSVQNVEVFRAGGTLVTVTSFAKGQEGQNIKILGDGLTTIQNNASIINAAGTDLLLKSGVFYSYILIGNVWYQLLASNATVSNREIIISVDGGGAAIVPGSIRLFVLPNFKGTITGATLIGDSAAGTATIDIWRATSPTIPTVANTIVAAALPTLAATQLQNTVVTTWTKTIPNNSIFAVKVVTCTVNTKLTLSLSVDAEVI